MNREKLDKIKAEMTGRYRGSMITPGQIIEMVFEALEMVLDVPKQIEETKKIEFDQGFEPCPVCGLPRKLHPTKGLLDCQHCGDTCPF